MGGSAFNPRLERTLEQPQGQSFNNRYLDKGGIDEQGQNPFVRHRDQPEVDDRLKVGLIDKANGRLVPPSFDLVSGRRQSRPPVKAGVNAVEARDVVPARLEPGERRRGCGIVRTSRLQAWGVSGFASRRKP